MLASLLPPPPPVAGDDAAKGLGTGHDLILLWRPEGTEEGAWPVVVQLMASTEPLAQGLSWGWNLLPMLCRLPLGEEGLFLYLNRGLLLPGGPGLWPHRGTRCTGRPPWE